MRIFKERHFGNVTGYELGWSPVGRPMMTCLCYRVGPLLIDTGMRHMRSAVVNMAGQTGIEAVFLTHYHEDHSGNAGALRTRFGIPVFGSEPAVQKLRRPHKIFPYQHLMWGAADPVTVDIFPGIWKQAGFRFESVHTPGHSKDHLVYLEPNHGWLFSGDLYLAHQIKYFRADEHIDEQIGSLKKVLSLDFDALFCAHRPQPVNGKHYIRKKLQYLEDFFGQVAALAKRGMNENQIMRQLHLKEQHLIKWMCFGNVSMKNMVRSVMRSLSKTGENMNYEMREIHESN